MNVSKLGMELSQRKKALGLTVDDIVAKTGISRKTVVNVLKGRGVNILSCLSVAEALGCKLKFE